MKSIKVTLSARGEDIEEILEDLAKIMDHVWETTERMTDFGEVFHPGSASITSGKTGDATIELQEI